MDVSVFSNRDQCLNRVGVVASVLIVR